MSDRSVIHTTFTHERVYAASPARVFAAWADPAAKARWFAGPSSEHELDFRLGGREVARGRGEDGSVLTFESVYHDIVPDRRIVCASALTFGDTLATVSVTCVELSPEGEGTRLVLTEQDTFLDGHEQPAWREQGTLEQLTALEAELRR
ncbi:SRPBCC family protein [Planotetraspora kaengkrachanensis]|uniref:Activator of HSP90 ATPase n=1 Tax=Planotetraspora kaengkrachanensis TaxID=575193 RepID=A0A8J3PYK9_9ACTN|nr:SRPBCC family protein [Planotetraspora kaengkrachanensis]GIG83507.1 activator of HSP90 ATPase [Planotetraspora kaengkrachanensis]